MSGEDIRLEAQDDIAPLPENAESDTEYPDDYAPIGEGIVEDDADRYNRNMFLGLYTAVIKYAQKQVLLKCRRKTAIVM